MQHTAAHPLNIGMRALARPTCHTAVSPSTQKDRLSAARGAERWSHCAGSPVLSPQLSVSLETCGAGVPLRFPQPVSSVRSPLPLESKWAGWGDQRSIKPHRGPEGHVKVLHDSSQTWRLKHVGNTVGVPFPPKEENGGSLGGGCSQQRQRAIWPVLLSHGE